MLKEKGLSCSQIDKTMLAILEKIRELLHQGYGDMTIKIHDGRIDYVELTRKAKTDEGIRQL